MLSSEKVKKKLEESLDTEYLSNRFFISKVTNLFERNEEEEELMTQLSSCLYKNPAIEECRKFNDHIYIIKACNEKYFQNNFS